MLAIVLVPLVGLVALGLILNAYNLDSIRLFWLVTLGDITGIAGILALGVMIASMDQSMFMVNAAAVIAGVYLLVKLAMHYDT